MCVGSMKDSLETARWFTTEIKRQLVAEESFFVRKGRKPHCGRNVRGSPGMFAFCRFLF